MTAVVTVDPKTRRREAVEGAPRARSDDKLLDLYLTQLRESPWNPRKHFDPAKLAEMVESLKKGQLAPIIVRPLREAGRIVPDLYEIGAGHRRFRSAPAAGLASLLAIVRDLDDVAFLELLTIENKQRDDVAPLDEANGFKLLMHKAGYDVQKLANRIGLSKEYVYGRLKLLSLIPELKTYLEDGVITAGHAVLLARLTPADQKRVMGNPGRMNRYGYSDGTGLFQPDHADHDPEQPALDLKQPIKARSVRELATYINDHVRFKPDENDLPNLFPAAQAALEEAKGDDLQPVYITYDHQLKFDAKDHKVRTYGVMSWRRADGQVDHDGGKKSKTCAWSRIGIVAAGRHRGDAFRVCVNRDKCEVHFAASARAKKRRAKALKSGGATERLDDEDSGYTDAWERRHKAEEAARKALHARFEKAASALLTALGQALIKQPIGPKTKVGGFFLEELDIPRPEREHEKYLPGGSTADGMIRRAVFAHVAYSIAQPYDGGKEAFREFGLFGVDAKKILDEVAPVEKPKAEKKPATKKAKKGAR